MLKSAEIRRQAGQRLRDLFPQAKGWEESADVPIGGQTADLMVKFRLGEQERVLVLEVCSLGQPRQIRAAVTRLTEVRREMPTAYPLATAVYIGPQSARILKSNNLGYLDLSGNCYLALENVLVERSEEHTSELQSLAYLVCRLLLEKKKKKTQSSSRP